MGVAENFPTINASYNSLPKPSSKTTVSEIPWLSHRAFRPTSIKGFTFFGKTRDFYWTDQHNKDQFHFNTKCPLTTAAKIRGWRELAKFFCNIHGHRMSVFDDKKKLPILNSEPYIKDSKLWLFIISLWPYSKLETCAFGTNKCIKPSKTQPGNTSGGKEPTKMTA